MTAAAILLIKNIKKTSFSEAPKQIRQKPPPNLGVANHLRLNLNPKMLMLGLKRYIYLAKIMTWIQEFLWEDYLTKPTHLGGDQPVRSL